MSKIKYLTFIILLTLASACREGTSIVYNPEDESYRESINRTLAEQFNYLWNGINNCYVYWSYDALNWDSIYREFMPRFEELDYKAQHTTYINNDEIRPLLEASFGRLLDRHLSVGMINPYARNGESKNIIVQPGQMDIESRPDYHKNIRYRLKLSNDSIIMVDPTFMLLSPGISTVYNVSQFMYAKEGEETNEWYAYSCLINDNIPYLRMSSFYISKQNHTEQMTNVLQNFFSNVRNLSRAGRLAGVILDSRGNPGGLTNDLNYIPGLFIDEPMTVARRRTKNGLGRYDYEGWTDVVIQSTRSLSKITDFNAPFVVLQDMNTISTGELVSYAISKLPTGYIIGENTMGAFGTLLTAFDIYHAGSFNVGNADTEPFVYCSTYQSSVFNDVTRQWENIEGGGGFAPDKYVPLDTTALYNRVRDNQLDAALDYIK